MWHRVNQKKLDQNKMSITFCFIIDILFMNSFLVLMFFKKELTKKWSFNHITSKDIYKWKKYIKNKLFKFRCHLTLKWINNDFIATIYFNKTLKSLHCSGKSYFLINFNNNRTKFSQTRSWLVFLLLLQRLLNVVETA